VHLVGCTVGIKIHVNEIGLDATGCDGSIWIMVGISYELL